MTAGNYQAGGKNKRKGIKKENYYYMKQMVAVYRNCLVVLVVLVVLVRMYSNAAPDF